MAREVHQALPVARIGGKVMSWWGWVLFGVACIIVLWFAFSIVAINDLKARQQRRMRGRDVK